MMLSQILSALALSGRLVMVMDDVSDSVSRRRVAIMRGTLTMASPLKLMYCPLPSSASRREVTTICPDVSVASSASAVGTMT